MDFLFDSDLVHALLKATTGRDRRPNYVNDVVGSSLSMVSSGNINMVLDCYGWSQVLLNCCIWGCFELGYRFPKNLKY